MKNLATLKLAKKVTNSFKFSARYLSAVKSEEMTTTEENNKQSESIKVLVFN